MARPLRMGPACYHVLHLIPPMVAHEMNFFYDEGLHDEDGQPNYSLVPGGLAPFTFEKETLAQAMKEKSIDVAMDVLPASVMALNRQGHDLFIIAAWRNQAPGCVMGAPTIKSLAELKGKRIGARDNFNVQWRGLAPSLLRAGVDPRRDVVWVRGIQPSQAVEVIHSGRVDAAFVAAPDVPWMLEEGFTLLLDVKAQYPRGRPDRIVAATGRAIAEKPDMLTAYLRGMLRSYWFIRKQPENFPYLQNLERRLRLASPDLDEHRQPLACASPTHVEQMPFPPDGIPTALGEYLQEQVALGELEEAGDPERILRLELVREAFRQLSQREELKPELARAQEVVARLGY